MGITSTSVGPGSMRAGSRIQIPATMGCCSSSGRSRPRILGRDCNSGGAPSSGLSGSGPRLLQLARAHNNVRTRRHRGCGNCERCGCDRAESGHARSKYVRPVLQRRALSPAPPRRILSKFPNPRSSTLAAGNVQLSWWFSSHRTAHGSEQWQRNVTIKRWFRHVRMLCSR